MFIVPDGVTSIGMLACRTCSKQLTDVIMPDSVITINHAAFAGCINLKSVKFSENLQSIGNNAFSRCKRLEVVMLPHNLKRIEWCAFTRCTSLRYLQLNDGLEYIGLSAFSYTRKLNTVEIPASVERIENYAFAFGKIVRVDLKSKNTIFDGDTFHAWNQPVIRYI